MTKRIKYYQLTEWPLVKRWLLIALAVLATICALWLVINLKVQYCAGMSKTQCDKQPIHSIRNVL